MTVAAPALDVFLSFAPADREIAEAAERSLVDAGLIVRQAQQLEAAANLEEDLRTLLIESDAVVVVLTPNSLKSSSVLVEIGAALALNIPVHLLLSGVSEKELPAHLREFPASRMADVDSIGDLMRRRIGAWKLREDDRSVLAELYQELGMPLDKLSYSTAALDKLTRQFNRSTGKNVPSNQLLHFMLTLRKRGQLPRLRRRA